MTAPDETVTVNLSPRRLGQGSWQDAEERSRRALDPVHTFARRLVSHVLQYAPSSTFEETLRDRPNPQHGSQGARSDFFSRLLVRCDPDDGAAMVLRPPRCPADGGGVDAAAPLGFRRGARGLSARRHGVGMSNAAALPQPTWRLSKTVPSTPRRQQPSPSVSRRRAWYREMASRTVAETAVEFEPRFPLWTDGTDKRRWLLLPEGGQLDTSDSENWRFPVGTRLFKGPRRRSERPA